MLDLSLLKNIETNFKTLRLYSFIFGVLCLFVCMMCLYFSYVFAEKQREKIYVLDQGKSLILALSQQANINRPIEAREHLRRFHELFFTLSPEANAIENNIQRALTLADKSAYNYYFDLAEKGYYNRLISAAMQQTITIDSVVCNFDDYPIKAITYAKQHLSRQTNQTMRSLITSCTLSNATRSDSNPQGFIIENLRVLDNKTLQQSLNNSHVK